MGTGSAPAIMNIKESDSWVEGALKTLLEVGLTVGGGMVGSMAGPAGASLGAGLGQQLSAGITGEQMLPSGVASAIGTVGTLDTSKFRNPFTDPDPNSIFGKIGGGLGFGGEGAPTPPPAPAQNLTLEGGVPTPARIDPQARFGAGGSQIGRANTALDTMQPGVASGQVAQNLRAAVAPITIDPLNYAPQGLPGYDTFMPPVDDFGPEGRFPTHTFSPFQGEPGFQLTPLQALVGAG